jgi:uncharacterized protein (DUF1501 family)
MDSASDQIHADRCIACEELELARVSDQRPSQTLPIPNAAMAGFPEGRSPHALTRRRLLGAGVAGFASIYAPRLLGFESIWEAALAEGAVQPSNQLVVLYLAGGNDGLNSLVPVEPAGYANYQSLRPVLYRGQGATAGGRVGSQPLPGAAAGQLNFANPLVSSSAGGDNGSTLYGFDKLYGAGDGAADANLAILPAVDYLPPNLSHFESSDYWFAGALQGMSTGWLGRWLDRNGSQTNPLQAISIDTALSKSIRTQSAPVCAINSLSSLGFTINRNDGSAVPPGTTNPLNANTNLAALAGVGPAAGNPHLARSRGTYGTAVDVYNAGKALGNPNPSVTYPSGTLGNRLKLAAHLLGAGLGTKVITVHWGSFDTHSGQLAGQDPQLVTLSLALGAFQADLAARGIGQNVTTLIFSEFGRRVDENGSAGTDHGAGGLVMLAGQPVKGGWAAPFPGTTAAGIDANGNLKVPTDFRSVYQHVIAEWLGDDPTAILGQGFPDVARQDGLAGLFK